MFVCVCYQQYEGETIPKSVLYKMREGELMNWRKLMEIGEGGNDHLSRAILSVVCSQLESSSQPNLDFILLKKRLKMNDGRIWLF